MKFNVKGKLFDRILSLNEHGNQPDYADNCEKQGNSWATVLGNTNSNGN